MQERITSGIRVDKTDWRKVKQYALDKDLSINAVIEKIIKEFIKKTIDKK